MVPIRPPKKKMPRHTWTTADDAALQGAVATHGAKWHRIATTALPEFSDSALRNRYRRMTGGPPTPIPWSDAERRKLIALVCALGPCWNGFESIFARPRDGIREEWQWIVRHTPVRPEVYLHTSAAVANVLAAAGDAAP